LFPKSNPIYIGFNYFIRSGHDRLVKIANNGKFIFTRNDTDTAGVLGNFGHDGGNYDCISEGLRKQKCLYFGVLITYFENDSKSSFNHVNSV
jgi:hypothetical protein